jgi:AAA domain/UvrD-like helicase C-terminal domain
MSDLVGLTLEPLLAELSDGGDLNSALVELREPLRTLRKQYRGGQPDFSIESARTAYSIAYHPYHAHLALTVLNRFADALQFDGPVLRVAILGAGPAPELVALAQFLDRCPSVQRLEVDLVDREPEWEKSRQVTIGATVPLLWSGDLQVRHHTLDLTTNSGVEVASELVHECDLVFAQAIFTELRMRDRADTFMNRIIDSFGARSLLLTSDFSKMDGFTERLEGLEARADLRTLRSVAITCPMPRAPDSLDVLYTGDDGLIERRKAHVESRLYVRPGWVPAVTEHDASHRTVPDQVKALLALAEFFRDDSPGVFVLTGSAGTGKTQLIARAAADAESAGRFTQLWAPTGQAARRLAQRTRRSASTIHSALYASPERVDRGEHEPPQMHFALRDDGVQGRVVFVDESSLLGNRPPVDLREADVIFGGGCLLDDILTVVTVDKGKVVFVGDRFQLAPYGEDRSLALDASYFADRNIPCRTAELTTVNRQGDHSAILELARKCRDAVEQGADLPPFEPVDGADTQVLESKDIPQWLLTGLLDGSAVAVTFRHADAKSWNERARRSAKRSPDLPVAGDRMVTVQAAHGIGLLNGEELRVVEANDVRRLSIRGESVDLVSVVLQYRDPAGTATEFRSWVVQELLLSAPSDVQRRVRRVLWRDFVRRAEQAGVKRNTPPFFELLETDPFANALYCMYSYARTCHRAQGGEWEHAICDLSGTTAILPTRSRFGYTALTRARTSAWLHNWPRSVRDQTAGRFEDFVEFALEQTRLVAGEVVPVRENGGAYVSLRRKPGDREVIVNLWPTNLKSQIQGAPPTVDRVALKQVLDRWANDRLALDLDPPDDCLEPTLQALHLIFDQRGMDLVATKPAAYQVQFTLHAGARRARIRFWHRANGALGSELKECADGDADLLILLRQAMADYREGQSDDHS